MTIQKHERLTTPTKFSNSRSRLFFPSLTTGKPIDLEKSMKRLDLVPK